MEKAIRSLVQNNEKHDRQAFLLARLSLGADVWNKWRSVNRDYPIDFSGVEFTSDGVSFEGCQFGDNANFMNAVFDNNTNFQKAVFGDNTNFQYAMFGDNSNFLQAKFGDNTNFLNSHFGNNTSFNEAVFGNMLYFTDATFGNRTEFLRVTFGSGTNFTKSKFGHRVDFSNAVFGSTRFDEATFAGDTFFMYSTFRGYSSFDGVGLKENFNIARAKFYDIPSFESIENGKCIRLNHAKFHINRGWLQWTSKESVIRRIQSLRGVAEINHATNEIRDLFILERQAERGILWGAWREEKWSLAKFRQAAQSTILLFTYWLLADFGRSVFRPILAMFAVNIGFFYLYQNLYRGAVLGTVKSALRDYTLTNSIPFGRLMNPAFEQSLRTLFELTVVDSRGIVADRYFDISLTFQVTGMLQSIVSGVLIFLIALGIRNYFRIDVTG